MLSAGDEEPFIDKTTQGDTPMLFSDDGKVRLGIFGWIKTVEWLQWYDVHAEPGGVLESDAHQRGSIESLSVIEGEFEVEVGDSMQQRQGRRDAALPLRPPPHRPQRGRDAGHATMVCILKAAVMD